MKEIQPLTNQSGLPELQARPDKIEAGREAARKREEAFYAQQPQERWQAEGRELQRIEAWAEVLTSAVNQAPDGLTVYRMHVSEAVRRIHDIINELPREAV